MCSFRDYHDRKPQEERQNIFKYLINVEKRYKIINDLIQNSQTRLVLDEIKVNQTDVVPSE